jgi:malonate transporter and related proteins
MQGVFEGFATIGVVIALGALLGHLRFLDLDAQMLLSRLSFFVASPALIVTVLDHADVAGVLSANLLATFAGFLAASALYVVGARLVWRHDLGDTVIGLLCSSYVNAGNLGLPIAAYVLGDAALVAPTLLLQLLVLQPLALAALDHASSSAGFSIGRALLQPVTNPLTVGSIAGVLLAITGLTLPGAVREPLQLVGDMAVPSMLLAYGVSLRLGPRAGHGTSLGEIGWITVLKLIVQPATAYAVARFALGVNDAGLLAITVLAALPTAQNIFVHATRYRHAEVVARDSIFVTTLLAVPAILVIAAVLA